MKNWAPLSGGLVDSSIWEEPDHVFRVFMAMLSLKDRDHVVAMDGYKLAKRIHMEVGLVTDALRVLSEPDSRRPEQEFGGRRIQKVEDGWLILQGEAYKAEMQQEARRQRNRRAQAAYRDRQKMKGGGKPLAGEAAYVKALESGDAAGANRVLGGLNGLPEAESSPAIPEVPTREQAVTTNPDSESGQWIDGEWVPD